MKTTRYPAWIFPLMLMTGMACYACCFGYFSGKTRPLFFWPSTLNFKGLLNN